MKLKKLLAVGMMGLAPLGLKAQTQNAIKIIPEAGFCGTLKSAPMAIGGVNAAYPKSNNYADIFIGGSLDRNATPGFVGIAFDDYSWSKNISSWMRDLFMASKNGITSTLDFAPLKINIPVKNFIFSIMPAYNHNYDFINKNMTQSIKGIIQTLYEITKKDKISLEIQYGTTPMEKITDTHLEKFTDTFNFTTTYSRVF